MSDLSLSVSIEEVLSPRVYVSKRDGAEHRQYVFIAVPLDAQFPRKIEFRVFNEELWSRASLVVGGKYSVSFDIESRSVNGSRGVQWFTSCVCWRIVPLSSVSSSSASSTAAATTVSTSTPAPTPTVSTSTVDDLPF